MDFREYEYNDSIFNEEDFKISKIKWIVENKLSHPFWMYSLRLYTVKGMF